MKLNVGNNVFVLSIANIRTLKHQFLHNHYIKPVRIYDTEFWGSAKSWNKIRIEVFQSKCLW